MAGRRKVAAPAAGDKIYVPNMDWEQLPAHLAAWRPGTRSIRQPFAFGQRPDGTPVTFAIWRPDHGALHPLMGGMTGGGKTNTLNVLTAGIVSCADTVIWYIDVAKKGQAAAPWGPCLDWVAKTTVEAVAMLGAGVRVIEIRSDELARAAARDGDDDKVVPSLRQPHLIIIIDEAAALFGIAAGDESELAMQATELARQIAQTGRSAAVSLLIATQRPTVASLGNDGDLRAQLWPGICLRMKNRGDTSFVITGVDLDLVDASQLNRPGLLYLQDADGTQPIPTRSFALYRPPAVRALARMYGAHRCPLEPGAIRAAGGPYARRPADPFGLLGIPEQTPTARPTPAAAPSPAKMRISSAEPGSEPTEEDHATVRNVLQTVRATVADVRSVVANGEQLPELPRIPVGQLAEQHTAEAVPEQPGDAEKRCAILAVLDEAPPEGMKALDIRQAVMTSGVELSRAHVYVLLRQLDDAGEAHMIKVGRNNLYHRGPTPLAAGRVVS